MQNIRLGLFTLKRPVNKVKFINLARTSSPALLFTSLVQISFIILLFHRWCVNLISEQTQPNGFVWLYVNEGINVCCAAFLCMRKKSKAHYTRLLSGKPYTNHLGKPSKKKKFIFLDFVWKREGGSGTKPTFLHKDNLGSNFKGRGAKLLFPKSNILFG